MIGLVIVIVVAILIAKMIVGTTKVAGKAAAAPFKAVGKFSNDCAQASAGDKAAKARVIFTLVLFVIVMFGMRGCFTAKTEAEMPVPATPVVESNRQS